MAIMRGVGSRDDPAQQKDDLADDELRDASGIGERRIENGNPVPPGGFDINPVGAYAEAADGDEPVRRLENVCGDLRA
ncbi:hypothetical protein V1280_007430 [Bradyrhizobium sp. AZCC 2230]